jgi:hypothetical protein
MRLYSALAILLFQGLQCCDALTVPKITQQQGITPRPAAADQTSCTQESRSPGWDILDLAYNRLNFGPPCLSPSGTCGVPGGGGQPPQTLYYGELVFDVVNIATNESHHCDVRALSLSDLNPGNEEEWLPCIDSIIFINLPEYATDTMFRFSHTSNMLELNQTWTCDDDQGHNFTAYGRVSPVLDPRASYIGNRGLGEVHVSGISPDLTVPGNIVSEQKAAKDTSV